MLHFDVVDERIDASHSTVYWVALAFILSGLISPFVLAGAWAVWVAVGLLVVGGCTYLWLLRTFPRVHYRTYFRLSVEGIHYRDPLANEEILLEWDRLRSVTIHDDGEFLALDFILGPGVLGPGSHRVPMMQRSHAEQACSAISEKLEEMRAVHIGKA